MGPQISYAQRYEDLHLLRCFGEQASGFYIDVGAGHPVYDNVSFVFYLRGWRGITVEPNPWLAQLSGAVRPRDIRIQSLIGKEPGILIVKGRNAREALGYRSSYAKSSLHRF